ncbi:MAG: hypothetical protein D6791_11750 [Chloroflexi bacterium]|nr:MAG: hypothetical protein D6791_11750 [Chloroflexota bacterium]
MTPQTDVKTMLRAIPVFGMADDIPEAILAEIAELHLEPGEELFHAGDPSDHLYFLLSGGLTLLERGESGEFAAIDRVEPNEPIGEIELMMGGQRTCTARADAPSHLLSIPNDAFDRLALGHPELMAMAGEFARRRVEQSQLLAVLRQQFGADADAIFAFIEAEVEWVRVADGDWLVHEHDAVDGLYILLSGRLQHVASGEVVDESEAGDIIGAPQLIAGLPWNSGLQAMHESTLARLRPELFERLLQQLPSALRPLSGIAISSLQIIIEQSFDTDALVTIAVIPLTSTDVVTEFSHRLVAELEKHGKSLFLNSEMVDAASTRPRWSQIPADDPWQVRLTAWLDGLEARYRFVVYQTDYDAGEWSRRAIQRAEYLLLVDEAGGDPGLSDIEQRLVDAKTLETVRRRVLVLLHENTSAASRGARHWLSLRNMEDVQHIRRHRPEDLGRLARFLSGRSMGIVFGGGGARGFAHIGVVKAFEEIGFPLDFVGGTSAGGMAAASVALGQDSQSMRETVLEILIRNNPFKSYTLPLMSLVRQQIMDGLYRSIWGDTEIADLWLPYFSIAADITAAEMVVQRSGKVWEAVRATQSLPGIVVPLIRDGHLLIDGGVIDNVPVDTMQALNRGPVVAVNVSPEEDLQSNFGYNELPSPWQVLKSRLFPFADTIRTFTIADVMVRSIVVNSLSRRAEAQEKADLWLNPPVSAFGLLELTEQALDALIEIGYEHTLAHRQELMQLMDSSGVPAV